MEALKKDRKVLRGSFTRAAKDLSDLLGAETRSKQEINVAWTLVNNKYEALRQRDQKIYEGLLDQDDSEENLSSELDGADGYFRTYTGLKLSYEESVQSRETVDYSSEDPSDTAGSQVGNITGRRNFKLPRIEFQQFSGEIREWLSFWSQFRKLDEDINIDAHDKIAYLVQATVPGSRARQVVESFPPMQENYPKIIDCLKSRFGREDLQIEVYVRELLKLIISTSIAPDKLSISTLYDRIETQLRALETLGITRNKCAPMLYPLIESCLPEDLIRIWQRSSGFCSGADLNLEQEEESTLELRLRALLSFLRTEVEGEQRIALAAEGLGLASASSRNRKPEQKVNTGNKIPTASGLMNCEVAKSCIFCNGLHTSEACFKAQTFNLERKRDLLSQKRACYRCLKIGHVSRSCRMRLKCMICGKGHTSLMCPELAVHAKVEGSKKDVPPTDNNLANHCKLFGRPHVFLQTLRVKLRNGDRVKEVRALLDSGSQGSYILMTTAQRMGYVPKRTEKRVHSLFGGSNTKEQSHQCYEITLTVGKENCDFCQWEVLDQPVICGEIEPIPPGPWVRELQIADIQLSDVGEGDTYLGPIELLIGADVLGDLYTGKKHTLESGLVAMETRLGWTLMGKSPKIGRNSHNLLSLSLFASHAPISNLWDLDVLGILDPVEEKTREEKEIAAKVFFEKTVQQNEDKRYEVRLPWLEEHPPLPDNFHLAEKRLTSTIRKLENDNLLQDYVQVFQDWINEEIIEEVPTSELRKNGHYLPHRPVIKENSSTSKIRPVFDASANEKGKPSLNQCLEKGPNLIEQIPPILLRFRLGQLGVVSDIRKAFLQISLHPADRDFLRFLWIDSNGEKRVYRHRRVVFGVTSSPFLLGATIEHHLAKCLENCRTMDVPYSSDTIVKLSESFYVDNCVTSVPDRDSLERFIKESILLMTDGQFDLRGWEFSNNTQNHDSLVPVLGLIWKPDQDTLTISENCIKNLEDDLHKPITKRLILSIAQRMFDPIGFTCPATLYPKLLLQEMWNQRLGWDEVVDPEVERRFRKWVVGLPEILKIEIPRYVHGETKQLSLHTFCDASKNAYAAVVFLRVTQGEDTLVFLLAAKTRVAPLKGLSIPRLELLAATIGARLGMGVGSNFKNENLDLFFWSDSTTVISWIRRAEQWATFVWNRVSEIRKLTPVATWRHLPGAANPADLPSRGCSVPQLLESRWWEGPVWLRQTPDRWPLEDDQYNENEILSEKRKTPTTTMLNVRCNDMHLDYFSRYKKVVRLVSCIFRFIHNCRNPSQRLSGPISNEEFNKAEIFIFKTVQSESFQDENDNRIRTLRPFCDREGLIRVKSRISNREDLEDFCLPIVLPAKHPIVSKLIFDLHENSCHVGTQGMLSLLRERFWILGGRRAVRSIISKCVTCKRQESKPFTVETPPLPADRVRDAVAFEVTGIDFAGPMFLRNGKKVWICLCTCAIYRAVHLELASSLSTECFLQAFRRFVARRGRPKTVYTDNGTNFVGAENAFRRLDWSKIIEYSTVSRITWKFNPPAAPWWGGFWERLVGSVKRLLRKVLGRASLKYEDLLTLVCECEAVVNSRPLTYMSEDPTELRALTPAMFLRDQIDSGLPDCDEIDRNSLCRRVNHKQQLRDSLKKRFRNEYLGQLQLFTANRTHRKITAGEIVLIGNDNDKRMDWPMGRVDDLICGSDGEIRLVRLTTAKGQLLRPVQRLYPLECVTLRDSDGHQDNSTATTQKTSNDLVRDSAGVSDARGIKSKACDPNSVSAPSAPNTTRRGRTIRPPKRFI